MVTFFNCNLCVAFPQPGVILEGPPLVAAELACRHGSHGPAEGPARVEKGSQLGRMGMVLWVMMTWTTIPFFGRSSMES